MKTLNLCVFLAFLAAVAGCTTIGESYSYCREGFDFNKLSKVAVLDVTGPHFSEAARNQIADFFATELLKKGFSPVERAQVQSLLKEQKFQISGQTAPKDAAKAGQLLNVPAVMLIEIGCTVETGYWSTEEHDAWIGGCVYKELSAIIGVQLINVEEGRILWSCRVVDVLGEIPHATVAEELSVASGLSPDRFGQFQKIIKKICDKLPEHRVIQ